MPLADGTTTGMEKGLLKNIGCKKALVGVLIKQQAKEQTIAMSVIGKYGGKEAVKEFLIETEAFQKSMVQSIVLEYTNKKGAKHLAHYYRGTNQKYWKKANSETEVAYYTGYSIPNEENFDKFWEITDDFKINYHKSPRN